MQSISTMNTMHSLNTFLNKLSRAIPERLKVSKNMNIIDMY